MSVAPGLARQVVVVIDDDPSLRELYATALRRAGFEAMTVADGESGLRLITTERVGLVLCDLAMPGMNGFDVIRALRASPGTATLPVILITGTGDADSVVEGLAAGADDFLAKPVRLDELVARVRAHIRTQAAWADVVHEELRARASVVLTLARLQPSNDPEEAARAIVAEVAQRPDVAFVAVFQVMPGGRGRILASSLAGGAPENAPVPGRMRYLIDRARGGPWTEELTTPEADEASNAFWEAGLGLVGGAPIFVNEALAGILIIGRRRVAGQPATPRVRDLTLATVIDYAAVLGAALGPTLAARSESQAHVRRLRRILTTRQFDAAFQPVVDLERRRVLGFEALTRFRDGTPPAVQFAEAAAMGMGTMFELATLTHAVERAAALPAEAFVCLNVSPDLLMNATDQLRRVLPPSRSVILEVTEHVPIDDYRALRDAIASLGDVRLSVDDAGAGFASMRHILELQPSHVKLDISLVRGIGGDELRQSLAAGLVYYALRSGFELIAEGVEHEDEAETLQRLGVDMGQGYLFGRPELLSG